MGRLRQMPGRLSSLPPRLAGMPQADERDAWRYASKPSRKWMNSARWRGEHGLRWQVLREAGFTCEWPGCGRVGDSRDLVADPREPHRDDPALFWDRANLWCLCKPCHDSKKQRVERRG